jgi:hypothetical protein
MAETIEDLDVVTLIRDLQEEGLPAGQAGTVVFVHNGGAAFEVEFMLSPRRSVVATVGRDYLLKLKGLNFSRAAV